MRTHRFKRTDDAPLLCSAGCALLAAQTFRAERCRHHSRNALRIACAADSVASESKFRSSECRSFRIVRRSANPSEYLAIPLYGAQQCDILALFRQARKIEARTVRRKVRGSLADPASHYMQKGIPAADATFQIRGNASPFCLTDELPCSTHEPEGVDVVILTPDARVLQRGNPRYIARNREAALTGSRAYVSRCVQRAKRYASIN